jgi:hypothetical protein
VNKRKFFRAGLATGTFYYRETNDLLWGEYSVWIGVWSLEKFRTPKRRPRYAETQSHPTRG